MTQVNYYVRIKLISQLIEAFQEWHIAQQIYYFLIFHFAIIKQLLDHK